MSDLTDKLDHRRDGETLDGTNVTHALHDLRHAFAALMLKAGDELGIVSKALGHDSN